MIRTNKNMTRVQCIVQTARDNKEMTTAIITGEHYYKHMMKEFPDNKDTTMEDGNEYDTPVPSVASGVTASTSQPVTTIRAEIMAACNAMAQPGAQTNLAFGASRFNARQSSASPASSANGASSNKGGRARAKGRGSGIAFHSSYCVTH